jgi:hypothetical protein
LSLHQFFNGILTPGEFARNLIYVAFSNHATLHVFFLLKMSDPEERRCRIAIANEGVESRLLSPSDLYMLVVSHTPGFPDIPVM